MNEGPDFRFIATSPDMLFIHEKPCLCGNDSVIMPFLQVAVPFKREMSI